MRINNPKTFAAVLACGIGLAALPNSSQASTATFLQTVQGCSGGCGLDSNNTVVVSDSPGSGVFDILVSLDTTTATHWSFQSDPTGNGHEASFVFSDSSGALTLSNITVGFTANPGNPTSTVKIAPPTWPVSAYGISTDQQQVFSSLDFHVDTHNATETLAQFIASLLTADDGVSVFGADAYSGTTGKTGMIGFTQCGNGISCPSNQGTTPLPGAIWLFGTVLAGASGIGGWRRRKRNASLAIATA